jgi:hypothetical protein
LQSQGMDEACSLPGGRPSQECTQIALTGAVRAEWFGLVYVRASIVKDMASLNV